MGGQVILNGELLSNLLGVNAAVPPLKETRKVHLGGQFTNVRTGQMLTPLLGRYYYRSSLL